MKKKFLCVVLIAITVVSYMAFGFTANADDKQINLNVYNWGLYMDEDLIDEFEKRYTNITVNYTTFETNEAMYTKLKSGGSNYDLVFPSDYMIERLISEDMLEELNFDNIPNYANISDTHKNLYYDKDNKYSVPYLYGTVGIIYNTEYVKETPTSWATLWDEKYSGKILMFNNSRDGYAIPMALLGLDINSTDINDWQKATDKLLEQRSVIQSYVMDEIFTKMETGEAYIAPYYAGDYITMKENNPSLAFCFPNEKVNRFYDSMCIPKGAENKEAAELFINFLCEYDSAYANAEEVGYSSPLTSVAEAMKENDVYGDDYKYIYPDNEFLNSNTEIFVNLDSDLQAKIDDLWLTVKKGNSDYTWLYICVAAVVVIVVLIVVTVGVKRRKMRKEEIDWDSDSE